MMEILHAYLGKHPDECFILLSNLAKRLFAKATQSESLSPKRGVALKPACAARRQECLKTALGFPHLPIMPNDTKIWAYGIY